MPPQQGGWGLGLSFLELPLGPEENLQDQWSSNKSKHESFEKVNSLGTPKDKMADGGAALLDRVGGSLLDLTG